MLRDLPLDLWIQVLDHLPDPADLKSFRLDSLDLSLCASLSDSSLLSAARSFPPALRSIDLSRSVGISWKGLDAVVSSCPLIERVDLSHCVGFGDREAATVANAGGLREVRLDKCLHVTDVGLAKVAVGCARLERLGIKWCMEISDIGIELLVKKCPELKLLDVSYLKPAVCVGRERGDGESTGPAGDPLRQPPDQGPPPAPSLRLHPRVRAEDRPLRLQDRDPPRARAPLRLPGRGRPDPQHGREEAEGRRIPSRQARLQEGLHNPQVPPLRLPGPLPDPMGQGGHGEEAPREEEALCGRRGPRRPGQDALPLAPRRPSRAGAPQGPGGAPPPFGKPSPPHRWQPKQERRRQQREEEACR